MAINVVPGQVAVSDPSPSGPSAISNINNTLQKVIRLTSANFTTTGVDRLVAVLPADATIIGITTWVGTALTGNSVASPTLSLGTASAGTQFFATNAFPAGAAGTYSVITTITGIFQTRNIPYSTDIQVWARGICTTGNPTAGEMFMVINYVR